MLDVRTSFPFDRSVSVSPVTFPAIFTVGLCYKDESGDRSISARSTALQSDRMDERRVGRTRATTATACTSKQDLRKIETQIFPRLHWFTNSFTANQLNSHSTLSAPLFCGFLSFFWCSFLLLAHPIHCCSQHRRKRLGLWLGSRATDLLPANQGSQHGRR